MTYGYEASSQFLRTLFLAKPKINLRLRSRFAVSANVIFCVCLLIFLLRKKIKQKITYGKRSEFAVSANAFFGFFFCFAKKIYVRRMGPIEDWTVIYYKNRLQSKIVTDFKCSEK